MISFALIALTGVLAQDNAETPWLTNVKEARETTLKQEKPCVIILHLDASAL